MEKHWLPPGPWPPDGQLYCPLVTVEPVPADGWRSDQVTLRLRAAYQRIMTLGFEQAGVAWDYCLVQARGNGAIVLLPQTVPPALLGTPLAQSLYAALRAHNELHSKSAQLHLRMAAHLGTVRFDAAGPAGHSVELLLTLVEAAEFVAAGADASAEFSLIVSDYLYEEVIRHSGEPAQFRSLKVTGAGGRVQSWTWFQPDPEVRLTAAMFGGAGAPAGGLAGLADLQS
jgi:hypothetical protein